MKNNFGNSILAAALAAAVAAPVAVADTPPSQRGGSFSLGGSLGSARIDGSNFEDDDTSAKGFIATSFGDMLGAEAQYIDFGSYDTRIGGDADFDAITVAGTVGVPLPWATPYGKVGWAFQDAEGQSVNDEFSDDEVFYGVGLRFGPWRSPLSMRLEYERFDFGGDDLDLASLGLAFRFGGTR